MVEVLWTQQQDSGPDARVGHAMTYDMARRRVILFGGDPLDSELFGDTWEWDGDAWTQIADTGPEPRSGHRITYDSGRARIVLFGGKSTGDVLLGDTWEWDGNDWTQVADTGPDPRLGHQLAYDSDRSRVVLFGGEAAGPQLRGDTWLWDGNDWTQQQDIGPSARTQHAMTFDPSLGRVVLFGGDIGGATDNATWEWDGTNWVLRADFGPKPCAGSSMVFDGGDTLLFGGAGSLSDQPAKLSGATWQWDGKRWTQRQDIGPSPRWGHAMALDSARGRSVLFGGTSAGPSEATSTDALADTWEATVTGGVIDATFLLSPDTIQAGVWTTHTLTVNLAEPAPSEGVVVEVHVEDNAPTVVVNIPSGASTGQATFMTSDALLPGDYLLPVMVGGIGAARATLPTLHVIP